MPFLSFESNFLSATAIQERCVKNLSVKVKIVATQFQSKSSLICKLVYIYIGFIVKNLFFNYDCTQIVSRFVLNVFPLLLLRRQRMTWGPCTIWDAHFGTILDNLLPSAVVTKSPFQKTEVVLILLLVVSTCLCRIKGVYYIVMSRGTVQFPPQCTSGFGLGDGSKCCLCRRHSSQKVEFCVVEVTPLSVWYYLTVFLIGFSILFYQLLNRITWLTLLPFVQFFGVSLPIKGPAQSQPECSSFKLTCFSLVLLMEANCITMIIKVISFRKVYLATNNYI